MKNLLEFPDELILAIIGKLKKKYLKRARLVCKKLAVLAAPFLLDVIYVSPHTKNTNVLEAITQHPIFSKTVKHIIYDSAKFADYSLEDYFNALSNQIRDPRYRRARMYNNDVRELLDLIQPRTRTSLGSHLASERGFGRCKNQGMFMMGYHQFSLLAEEQKVGVDSPWFDSVREGLRRLGPIQSVTVENTWQVAYREAMADDISEDSSNGDENVDDDQDGRRGLEDTSDEWEDCGSSETSSTDDRLLHRNHLGRDGMRLVGSPLARAWPPSWLQPPSSLDELSSQELVSEFDHQEWYSVGQSFNLLARLLLTADKEPQILRVPGNYDGSEGLSPVSLDTDKSLLNPFSLIHLKTLHLKIAHHYQRRAPDLPLLKSFFKISKSLTSLSLLLFTTQGDLDTVSDDSDESQDDRPLLFNLAQIIPPIAELQLHQLRNLHLQGIETTYRDFAAFLFLNLPNLISLNLSWIQIQLMQEGEWEDIIEGLHRLKHLESCNLDTLLYSDLCSYMDERVVSVKEFMNANARYIVSGGRHPGLDDEEPDGASSRFLRGLYEMFPQFDFDKFEKVE